MSLLVKSSSIFVLFAKLRTQEIEQFNVGIKKLTMFLKEMSRAELFLKKVKDFRNPVDEKLKTIVNRVRNFETSYNFMIGYLTIFVLSFLIFFGIQMIKYHSLRKTAVEIRLSYSQIANIGFYNIYQNLGVIKIMEVIQNEAKGIPPSPNEISSYEAILASLKAKSFRFQLNSGLPTFKNVLFKIESISACELLENTSFNCTSKFEEIFFFNAFRSTLMTSILLMEKFGYLLKLEDRVKLVEKTDLMSETSTLTQSMIRLVSVFNKVNESLNNNLDLLTGKLILSAKGFLIIEIVASLLMLLGGGLMIYYYLYDLSMINSSFIKVLPFSLIVKNQYFQIYLNKNKY